MRYHTFGVRLAIFKNPSMVWDILPSKSASAQGRKAITHVLWEPRHWRRLLRQLTGIKEREEDSVHREPGLGIGQGLVSEGPQGAPRDGDLDVAHADGVWAGVVGEGAREERAERRARWDFVELGRLGGREDGGLAHGL